MKAFATIFTRHTYTQEVRLTKQEKAIMIHSVVETVWISIGDDVILFQGVFVFQILLLAYSIHFITTLDVQEMSICYDAFNLNVLVCLNVHKVIAFQSELSVMTHMIVQLGQMSCSVQISVHIISNVHLKKKPAFTHLKFVTVRCIVKKEMTMKRYVMCKGAMGTACARDMLCIVHTLVLLEFHFYPVGSGQ